MSHGVKPEKVQILQMEHPFLWDLVRGLQMERVVVGREGLQGAREVHLMEQGLEKFWQQEVGLTSFWMYRFGGRGLFLEVLLVDFLRMYLL